MRTGWPGEPAAATRSSSDLRLWRFLVVALATVFLASATAFVTTPSAVLAEAQDAALPGSPEIGASKAEAGLPILPQWIALAPLEDSAFEGRTIRLKPRPKPGAFSMNLFENGDFVSQATAYWCVSASVQTMMNIIDDGKPRRSRAFQKKLHRQGARMDDDDDPWDRKPLRLRGLGLTDWASLLNKHGYGPYEVDRAPARRKAIRKAAKALRRTGRPVGLVVWRGAHAWVMSGFTATADPAYTNDFKVKSVFIQDVWYPRVSSIWGRSRGPNAKVAVSALGQDYLRYDRPGRRHPMRDGKFMLILPKLPPDTRVR